MLIAGHDPRVRLQLAATLRADGYDVCEARSGLQILEHLGPRWRRVGKARVLILDITHDPWVGVALLRAVLCEDWEMPVVLVAAAAACVRAEARRLGVHRILTGPVDPEALRRVVAELIPTGVGRGCVAKARTAEQRPLPEDLGAGWDTRDTRSGASL